MTLQAPVANEQTGAAASHRFLRTATKLDHERVDRAFAGFDLSDHASYAQFLTAHARVLPAVERALTAAGLPLGPLRTEALSGDLAALGQAMPGTAIVALPDDAARWGAFYVIEGSRLGGALLAREVGPGLPRDYLAAVHPPGAWRAALAAIDDAAGDDAWRQAALAGAQAVFAAYEAAARAERADG